MHHIIVVLHRETGICDSVVIVVSLRLKNTEKKIRKKISKPLPKKPLQHCKVSSKSSIVTLHLFNRSSQQTIYNLYYKPPFNTILSATHST